MDVLITYDIKSEFFETKDTEVKDGMKELGYSDFFVTSTSDNPPKKTKYYLPNTTLWKNDTTPKQAKADLLSVARKVDAEVERLIALEFTDYWAAIPGKPYSGE